MSSGLNGCFGVSAQPSGNRNQSRGQECQLSKAPRDQLLPCAYLKSILTHFSIRTEDEEDDFPFKDWVATLGHRSLRGPFVSKRQQKVSQWLLAPRLEITDAYACAGQALSCAGRVLPKAQCIIKHHV